LLPEVENQNLIAMLVSTLQEIKKFQPVDRQSPKSVSRQFGWLIILNWIAFTWTGLDFKRAGLSRLLNPLTPEKQNLRLLWHPSTHLTVLFWKKIEETL
jgi:hypothetical protein